MRNVKLACEAPCFSGKTGVSEKTADQLCISLLSAWGVHYLYPPRNVFKALLRLTGALPKIIILSDGCHTLKGSQKSFMKCFSSYADESVVKISSRDTMRKVYACFISFLMCGITLFMKTIRQKLSWCEEGRKYHLKGILKLLKQMKCLGQDVFRRTSKISFASLSSFWRLRRWK